MSWRYSRISPWAILAAGLAAGWILASAPKPALRAEGGDRWGESILTTGPIQVRYHDGLKVQVAQDAVYYLDYKSGRLLAALPTYRQSVTGAGVLENFAERDLVADFKIDLENGPKPHFLMTTGALGTYVDGWSPLYVFESTTSQVAVYRVQQQIVGASSHPRFELLEIRSFASGTNGNRR